jgi:hypothetical protein
MTTTYRRKRNRDTWHFCSNCRHWPTSDYESTKEKPKSGEFCDQCRSKRSNDNRKGRQETLQQPIAREKFVSDCPALLIDVPGH